MATTTDTPARERVGRVVRGLIAASGATGDEVAAHLGISRSSLYHRMRGALPFSVDELEALSDYFDVPIGRFFGAPIDALSFAGADERSRPSGSDSSPRKSAWIARRSVEDETLGGVQIGTFGPMGPGSFAPDTSRRAA